KEGATLVTCAEDVVNALEPFGRRPYPMEQARTFEESASAPNATPEPLPDIAHDERSLVVAALGPSPVHVDELARATWLPIRSVQTVLLELALAGRIEHHGSQLDSLIAGRYTASRCQSGSPSNVIPVLVTGILLVAGS